LYAIKESIMSEKFSDMKSYEYCLQNDWCNDFKWIVYKQNPNCVKYPERVVELYPNERLWFNVLFYKTLQNLKENNTKCYKYLIENNLIT